MDLVDVLLSVLLLVMLAAGFRASRASARWMLSRQRRVHELPPEVLDALKMHPSTWDAVRNRETISLEEAMDLIIRTTEQLQGELDRHAGRLNA